MATYAQRQKTYIRGASMPNYAVHHDGPIPVKLRFSEMRNRSRDCIYTSIPAKVNCGFKSAGAVFERLTSPPAPVRRRGLVARSRCRGVGRLPIEIDLLHLKHLWRVHDRGRTELTLRLTTLAAYLTHEPRIAPKLAHFNDVTALGHPLHFSKLNYRVQD